MSSKRLNLVIMLVVLLVFPLYIILATDFSSTYDIATPDGQDSPSEADDRMREIKAAVQERLAVEHRFALTGTEVSAADTGEHTDITCDSIVNAGNVLFENGKGIFANTSDASDTSVISFGGGGTANDIRGGLVLCYGNENASFPGRVLLQPGTPGEIVLRGVTQITVGTLTLPSGASIDEFSTDGTLAGDSDTAVPTEKSVKTYVDAVPAFTPTSYAGEESIIFPNGLVMKTGEVVTAENDGTVTFEAPFDNAIVSIQLTQTNSSDAANAPAYERGTGGAALTSFDWHVSGSVDGFSWTVIGY